MAVSWLLLPKPPILRSRMANTCLWITPFYFPFISLSLLAGFIFHLRVPHLCPNGTPTDGRRTSSNLAKPQFLLAFQALQL